MATEHGESCLYVAIESAQDRHDRLLREMITPLVRELCRHDDLDSLFVVRFADPEWQLRFRVLGRPRWIEHDVRPRVERRLEMFRAVGDIGRIEFGEYVREWERYGGPEGMRLAEQVFFHDSVACLDRLESEARGECRRSRREWSLALTEDLLDLLGLDREARRRFYRDAHAWAFRDGLFDQGDREKLEQRYESVREALAALLSARRDGDVETVYGGPVPSAIARTWRETTATAITMLRQRHAEGAITEPLEHLAWSYAHLHCNRLGLDVPAEAILRYLMFRHYEDERVAPIAGPSI